MKNNGRIDKKAEQLKRIDILLKSSQPFEVFVNHFIHPMPSASITAEEVVAWLTKFCRKMNWPDIPKRKAQQLFHAHMQAPPKALT